LGERRPSAGTSYEREKSRARRAKVGTTRQRGYGEQHRRLRKAWESRVSAGVVDCARCHTLIVPGEAWDLGHDDEDRRRYSGPEHARCNRATRSHAEPERHSRDW